MLRTLLKATAITTICLAATMSAPAVASGSSVEKLNVAGSFLTSRIDANADGEASSWCTLQIKGGNQDSGMQQCVNEDVFQGFTQDCPGGLYVIDAVQGVGSGAGVRTFKNAKDQLFFALTERYLCTNEVGTIEGVDRGIVTGGTGKFEGATGSFTSSYGGQILYFDLNAQPAQFFGSILGTSEWTVISNP